MMVVAVLVQRNEYLYFTGNLEVRNWQTYLNRRK